MVGIALANIAWGMSIEKWKPYNEWHRIWMRYFLFASLLSNIFFAKRMFAILSLWVMAHFAYGLNVLNRRVFLPDTVYGYTYKKGEAAEQTIYHCPHGPHWPRQERDGIAQFNAFRAPQYRGNQRRPNNLIEISDEIVGGNEARAYKKRRVERPAGSIQFCAFATHERGTLPVFAFKNRTTGKFRLSLHSCPRQNETLENQPFYAYPLK